MSYMPKAHPRVKSQSGQFCLFAWADAQYFTFPANEPIVPTHELIGRTQRVTGWSPARCRATIEANGGRLYV